MEKRCLPPACRPERYRAHPMKFLLAESPFDLTPRPHCAFGVGAISRLSELVRQAGGDRVFLVTDTGIRAAGVVDPILARLTPLVSTRRCTTT